MQNILKGLFTGITCTFIYLAKIDVLEWWYFIWFGIILLMIPKEKSTQKIDSNLPKNIQYL